MRAPAPCTVDRLPGTAFSSSRGGRSTFPSGMKLTARCEHSTSKIMQARTEFARAMSEKDEDYRRRELALQERHSRELAKKSQESAQDMMMARPGEDEEGVAPQGGGGDAAGPGARERKSSKVRHSADRGRRTLCWATRAAWEVYERYFGDDGVDGCHLGCFPAGLPLLSVLLGFPFRCQLSFFIRRL